MLLGVKDVIFKSKVICRYNEHMGYIDLTDHFIASYSFISCKTIKWWRKMFFWLVEVAIVNSFILYSTTRESGSGEIWQRDFSKKLIHKLVGDTKNTQMGDGCQVRSMMRVLIENYIVYKIKKGTRKKIAWFAEIIETFLMVEKEQNSFARQAQITLVFIPEHKFWELPHKRKFR